jgi:hypothetical protein
MMQAFGPSAMFAIPVLFHGILAATAYLRMRVREATPVEDRAPFQPMPSERVVTGETVALDPRSDDNGAPADDSTPAPQAG